MTRLNHFGAERMKPSRSICRLFQCSLLCMVSAHFIPMLADAQRRFVVFVGGFIFFLHLFGTWYKMGKRQKINPKTPSINALEQVAGTG